MIIHDFYRSPQVETIYVAFINKAVCTNRFLMDIHLFPNSLFNSLNAKVAKISKLVNWFAQQISWLVFIWWQLGAFNESREAPRLIKTQNFCQIGLTTFVLQDNPFSTYAKYSKKLTFLTPWYMHIHKKKVFPLTHSSLVWKQNISRYFAIIQEINYMKASMATQWHLRHLLTHCKIS